MYSMYLGWWRVFCACRLQYDAMAWHGLFSLLHYNAVSLSSCCDHRARISLAFKNQHIHWVWWMSTSTNTGKMRREHVRTTKKNAVGRACRSYRINMYMIDHYLHYWIPRHDLHLSGQTFSSSVWSAWSVWYSPCCRAGGVQLAWSSAHFLGRICTIQILLASQNCRRGSRWPRSWSIWSGSLSTCRACVTFQFGHIPYPNSPR